MVKLKPIEVRGFMNLDAFLRNKYGSMPFYTEIDSPINGFDLAIKLGVSIEDVEVVFVNGFVQSLEYIIHPGDRIAFLPPGCPGPYKIALGFYNKDKKISLKTKKV